VRLPIRLRHKLLLVFLAATLLPLAAILWVSSALMQRSLGFVSSNDSIVLADALERVGRDYYRQACSELQARVAAGEAQAQRLSASDRTGWPVALQQFWDSTDNDRFILSEPDGDRLSYAVRHGPDVWLYSMDLNGVRLGEVTRQLQRARARAAEMRERDLPRGFTLALVIASAVVWVIALAGLVYLSASISHPIQTLTSGLREVAAGRLSRAVSGWST
jgi:hypothetical protein